MPESRAETLARFVARFEASFEQMVEDAASAIWSIPAYQARGDAGLLDEVRGHVREHFEVLLVTLREDRAATPEDLLFLRSRAMRRVGRISVADFIHAFQTGQGVVWDTALEVAAEDPEGTALSAIVEHVVGYFATATTHAAEVYLEAEQLLAVGGERVRRDLLEDLLAGRDPAPGPRLDAARGAGLQADASLAVIAARPAEPLHDEHALRGAATALGRAGDGALPSLTVVRQDEIVVVVVTRRDAGPELAARVEEIQRRLFEQAIPLMVGLSTVYDGLASVASAYREAADARERMLSSPGVAALPTMTVFAYLTSRADRTASRLVPERLASFIAEDIAQGGTLIATLRAYVACDLNVKRAAAQLHVHVNTAHHRISRLEERTGCDARSVTDLIEILIAARLADAA